MIDTVNSMLVKHADGPDAVIRIVDQKLDLVFKIDTGAEANVLPVSDYNSMSYASATRKVRNRFTSFMWSTLIASQSLAERLSILNVQSEPAPTMKPKTARILEEYGDVFEDVGKLLGKCKIHLKEGAVPTVQPPKRVPFALQEKLKEKLDRLEVMGIIEKTSTPTEWVNSIVVVQKPNGSLRICLDPVDLDKWVQRPYHPIPSLDDVAAKYDIAGTAANTEDHDAKLWLVLQRAREKGVRFNRNKCIFNVVSIPYFRHLLTTEGIKADPEKTKAIANIPAPESHEQLQVLLGMYNYLGRCIPNLSTLNHPLLELSKSKTYDWTTQHENARKQIKASICKNLSYFDHKSRNAEVIVDASQHGLGAQLVVDNKTVAFGSRSLSGAEKWYSQIEKDMLAITYACKYFRQYTYGRTTIITTNHKPL
ncbi:hypothetical protein QYM36_007117 [Artemia franciscana]|uniref:Reverse transcriptase/retrotransposon-derived protein RNase H-like domain-containing protein n=1 Tax=Artemia franciscana TaxID=6661 RepID=A0AA88I7N8_ARTSF|nr:hypothetical protein QYM36_007117 [Artemia franciscana]